MSTSGGPAPLVPTDALALVGDEPSATARSTRTRGLLRPTQRRSGLARTGLGCTYAACSTIPWTAVYLGPIRLGDAFLFLALGLLLLANPDVSMPRFPGWVWFFATTIVFVGLEHEVLPVAPDYLSQRLLPGNLGVILRGAPTGFSNLGVMVKFLVPVVGLPFLFGLARLMDHRALTRSAIAFAAGAAVSGLIAFTDVRGVTSLGQAITGIGVGDSRGSGLTEHPNYVAMGSVFAVPPLMWQMLAPRLRVRILATAGVIALLLGLYASGSRSGAGAGAVAVVASFAIIPRYRRVLPVVFLLSAAAVVLAFVVYPSAGRNILHAFRLTAGQGEGSDLARSVVNTQAQHDFAHSPVFGIGFEVAGQAHIVYLQALAAGGVVLLSGYLIFLLGALLRSYRAISLDPIAAPLFVSVLGGTIFGAAQDALTLRIVYVPSALATMLPLLRDTAVSSRLDHRHGMLTEGR